MVFHVIEVGSKDQIRHHIATQDERCMPYDAKTQLFLAAILISFRRSKECR